MVFKCFLCYGKARRLNVEIYCSESNHWAYLQGNKKLTNKSCLLSRIREDILHSSYLSFSVECDQMPEKEKLFKVANK